MMRLGDKSIDSIYLGDKVVTEVYLGSIKIWPEGLSYSNSVAILTSEDGTITQYFESCADAATYARSNSDTKWNLTVKSGDIPSACFADLTNLISLTLEEGVTSIAESAFYNCFYITGALIIPDSVTTLGLHAFSGCISLVSLKLSNNLTTIEAFAFYECSSFSSFLTIPDSVTSIGNGAFFACGGFEASLSIPAGVTYIGANAFEECSGFIDDLSYYGLNSPAGRADGVFTNTEFTVCKVPTDYEDDHFCGLPVSKVLNAPTNQ